MHLAFDERGERNQAVVPWRGERYEGEVPSLGWGLVRWYKRNLIVPAGPRYGEPLVLTPEQVAFVVRFYQVHPVSGRRVYRRGVLRRSKGWGKSPLLGAIAAGELVGPVVFAGWSEKGEPVGARQSTPYVQIAACSEDQTDNTYVPVYEMLREAPGLAGVLSVGKTAVFTTDGPGRLEPVTAAAGSREGQQLSFAVLDETHLWTPANGGKKLAATLRRNVSKNPGGAGSTIETTNAYRPGEGSVAEASDIAARNGQAGLLYDCREGPEVTDLSDWEAMGPALKAAYGDSTWVDLERIFAECNDVDTDPSDARRFYLNQIVQSSEQAFDTRRWGELADAAKVVTDGSLVTLGFKGGRFHDSTALVACEVESGHVWPVEVWDRPHDAGEGWEVPVDEVETVLAGTFDRFDVWRFTLFAQYWESSVSEWVGRWGDKRLVRWDGQRRKLAFALRGFGSAVKAGELSHDGSTALGRHVANARRSPSRLLDDDGRPMWLVEKEHPQSPLCIDGAVAAALGWDGRSAAVAAGALKARKRRTAFL
jgi:hypothetical protein